MTSKNNLLVAAIDFGSTSSGYAFSLSNDHSNIFTNQWIADGQGVVTSKAPTSVLLRPNQTFHSFGYEAEDEYARLSEANNHRRWYFFREFKMALYDKDLFRTMDIRDISGKAVQAMKIVSMVIQYLKMELEQCLSDHGLDLVLNHIVWILTVPAIWSEAAKQFMREAAIIAGIQTETLKLALEPEAASVYCRSSLRLHSTVTGLPQTDDIGQAFAILDLGGGTADLAAYEVVHGNKLRQIRIARGGDLGGDKVNHAFSSFLNDVFGVDVMETFADDFRGDYFDLMREFETRKRKLHLHSDNNNFIVKLPLSLLEVFKTTKGEELATFINGTEFNVCGQSNHVKLVRDKLEIHIELVRQFFKETVNGVVQFTKELVQDSDMTPAIETIVMVGGFSESPLVREAIERAFPDRTIIVPIDPGMAVLKGAVLLGHESDVVQSKISRYTYGVSCSETFVPGVHPESLKKKRKGRVVCKHVFEKFLEVGQRVSNGDKITLHRETTTNCATEKHEAMVTRVYCSSRKDPKLCIESEGCWKIGKIIHEPPKGGWPDVIESDIEIKLEENEFTVQVREGSTGTSHTSTFDFL